MKKILVYYSMTGNTDYVAKFIKNIIDIDLLRIEPVKEYPNSGFKKFFWGGKSALMKETPNLNKYIFKADKYDEIIIGSPIWAGNIAPPIRTFIKENKDKLSNKKISLVISNSGGNPNRAVEGVKKELNIKKINAILVLKDPKDKPQTANLEKINDFINEIDE